MAKNEITIQPNKGWLYLDWQGIIQYRDLMFLLVRRDFLAKYVQTILGPLWFIIQPLATTLVFTVIFGNVARIPTDGMPPLLFYLTGLLAWNYFASCFGATAGTLTGNAHLFSKVYFPRLIIPFSAIISNLFTLLVQLITLLGFLFYYKYFTLAAASIRPNLFILVLPLLIVQIAVLGMGFGLWMAALTAKYRDLSQMSGFLIQLWMYATPIIYPISLIPKKWDFLVAINPMAPIVELFRYAFLGVGFVSPAYLLFSVAISIFVLFTGIFIFNKTERTFVDII
ncbi:MAG: ABC transporter permease [bacterium]